MVSNTTVRCIHNPIQHNVHELILQETSIPAVAELFDIADRLMADTPAPGNLSLLIDTTVGVQPIGYCFSRMRALAAKYPGREQSRTAFILRNNPFWRMFDIFMRQFGPVRFFSPDQHDEAVAWLLGKEEGLA